MASTTDSWWRTDAQQWRSGGWSIELRGDELAEISYGGRMLLRAVRAAVRDHGWLTVPVAVSSVTSTDDSLALELRHEGLGALITSRLTVAADDEQLVISWEAVNGPDFHTCRVGLVALHPAAEAGTAAAVEHPDGSVERTAFPTAISPHQPIFEIRELRIDDGATLRFEGDVFEMEDQRNWTDASFKTYSRPLGLPYPYRLDAGERIAQSITVRPPRGDASEVRDSDAMIALVEAGMFPAVGVEASTAASPVDESDIGALRVVELNLTTPPWPAALARAAADGVPLDVRIVTDGAPDALDAVASALRGLDVVRVTPFDSVSHVSEEATVAAARAALSAAGVDAPVLAGARSHFTELNREQARIARDVAGIAVNTTPLFHTLDTEQLVEALPMQRLIALQSVVIADGLPVHIGPVSLRPRFNNVATSPEAAPTRSDLSEGYGAEFTGAVDARQSAPELAAWVVASAAALAVPGVETLSWFETVGPRGVEGTPAAEAVQALVSLGGGTLLTGESPDGLVWAVGSRAESGDALLVANVGREARRITVAVPGREDVIVRVDAGAWQLVRV
ncbi:hypothetical protein ACI3KS_09310 [Microbacterium sp. ZW T5_45]|uniref:hypothetical protein n=1 Tax=Microbacterium sp. ZW T5_45 TaxID=3378080 RepID=UPI0038554A46